MPDIRHIETVRVQPDIAPEDAGPGFSDMLSAGAGAQGLLYGTRPDETGLELREVGAGFGLRDRGAVAGSGVLDAPGRLILTEMDGDQVLLSYGRYGQDIAAVRLDAEGGFGNRLALRMVGADPAAVTAMAVTEGADLSVTASRQAPGLSVWQRTGETLIRVADRVAEDLLGANDVFDLGVIETGGQTRLLALSAGGDVLLSFALSPNGDLGDVQQLGALDGLFMDRPDQLLTVQVDGQTYVLIGASGSGSLAVVALDAKGKMVLRDHVIDDLNTRFDNMSVLEAVTLDGQVYVIAGGADDGLTLMTVLPGGRLLHLDTLPYALGMALDNPTGLALLAGDGRIDIAVSGTMASGLPGLSRLQVDLGEIGVTRMLGAGANQYNGTVGHDQIAGAGGDDTLSGGAGDDVLIDGAGRDLLRGGAGADVFVLVRDGQDDRIADFEPGVDRLDLSQMGWFYTVEALDISSTASGARIDLGTERVWIETADGAPLEAEDFTITDLRDLWHVSTAPPPPPLPDPPQVLIGTRGADLLEGGSGDDLVIGEMVDADFDAVSAQVYRLYQATLGRAPDIAGLQHWCQKLMSGEATLTEVAGRFAASAEFGRTYGALDDAGFVRLLYQNVLDRQPDPVGFASWTGHLTNGARSRAEVVEGFSQSREFTANTKTDVLTYGTVGLQAQFSDDVFRLYQATLDRAPDLIGFRDWTEKLAGGMAYGTAISGFTGSREFGQTYGETDDEGFVTLLYANVLDRTPDTGGLAHWQDRLDADDWSRAEVVGAFAKSREFVAKTGPELTSWARGRGVDDVLDGQGGHDILMGGILSDRFVFNADAGGHYVVVDFEVWDRLDFRGFGYQIPQDALAHMTERGSDVVFDDQQVRVVLNDTTLDDILF